MIEKVVTSIFYLSKKNFFLLWIVMIFFLASCVPTIKTSWGTIFSYKENSANRAVNWLRIALISYNKTYEPKPTLPPNKNMEKKKKSENKVTSRPSHSSLSHRKRPQTKLIKQPASRPFHLQKAKKKLKKKLIISSFKMKEKKKRKKVTILSLRWTNNSLWKRKLLKKKWALLSFRFLDKKHKLYPYLGKYGRSFTYDNGLLLVLFALTKRCREGYGIVQTLKMLQNPNGSWGFSFDTQGNNFYNRSYIRAGTVAWAGYGLALFAQRCRSQKALKIALKAAYYLKKLRIRAKGDPRRGFYRGGRGRWSLDYKYFYPNFRMTACVIEHQFDIYFFFKRLDKALNASFQRGLSISSLLHKKDEDWDQLAEDLADKLLTKAWIAEEGRFAAGVSKEKGLDRSRVLDSAGAWGALFLIARHRRKMAQRALEFTERHFLTQNQGIYGYRPYSGKVTDYPKTDWDKIRTIFLEGTASMAVAYQRLGNIKKARWLLSQLRRALDKEGGLPYAIGERKDFPAVAAAAPTLWFIFASLIEHHYSPITEFWTEY